ncbi:helix-turn-helix domain-containing protein [Streptomyces mobaraensis]|uniref:Helix-turn-helix transcriptional regulator n=1 Tax=Streptomyces mobaraensis TaxID=35621 RepID=A0A5N5W7S3_STRMB|nr:XRE family transcriptional regulator [Streptomyces mobaraensis]KAB7845035.1 helix-turn-helix transcriptional regulator [Streptomyces mobaraensis]
MRDDQEARLRLAHRLAALRAERDWPLDELARRTGVSRSTLSRLERAEISPTAVQLARVCAAFGRTAAQVLAEVEDGPPRPVRAARQAVRRDDEAGAVRRSVSPPGPGLRGEIAEYVLRPGAEVACEAPRVPGAERHLWVLEGVVEVAAAGGAHVLRAGDCLRFRLWGRSRFRCPGPEPARYALFTVLP